MYSPGVAMRDRNLASFQYFSVTGCRPEHSRSTKSISVHLPNSNDPSTGTSEQSNTICFLGYILVPDVHRLFNVPLLGQTCELLDATSLAVQPAQTTARVQIRHYVAVRSESWCPRSSVPLGIIEPSVDVGCSYLSDFPHS
jgi:hypothetical protein